MFLKSNDTKQRWSIRKLKNSVAPVLLGTLLASGIAYAPVSAEEVSTNATSSDLTALPEDVKEIVDKAQVGGYKALSKEEIARLRECGVEIHEGDTWKDVEDKTSVYLIYTPKGTVEEVVVPGTDTTTPAKNTTISKATTPVAKTVQSLLPNTGDGNIDWVKTAIGAGLLSVVGYLAYRHKKTGKTMLVALLAVGATGYSLATTASPVNAQEAIGCLDEGYVVMSKDYNGENNYEYVGYIVVTPKQDQEVKVTTDWKVEKTGEPLKPTTDGTHDKEDFDGYEYVKTVTDENGNTIHIYKPVEKPAEPEKPTTEEVETPVDEERQPQLEPEVPTTDEEETPIVEEPTPEQEQTPEVKVITDWKVEETGELLKPTTDGTHDKEEFDGYEYVKTVTDEEGNTTHIYRQVEMTPEPEEPATEEVETPTVEEPQPEPEIQVPSDPEENENQKVEEVEEATPSVEPAIEEKVVKTFYLEIDGIKYSDLRLYTKAFEEINNISEKTLENLLSYGTEVSPSVDGTQGWDIGLDTTRQLYRVGTIVDEDGNTIHYYGYGEEEDEE